MLFSRVSFLQDYNYVLAYHKQNRLALHLHLLELHAMTILDKITFITNNLQGRFSLYITFSGAWRQRRRLCRDLQRGISFSRRLQISSIFPVSFFEQKRSFNLF